MMAFLEILASEQAYICLPLGETSHLKLDPSPMVFSSPVSTLLPKKMADEYEEPDASTLGRPEPEEEP
jgi:hypothetical protein